MYYTPFPDSRLYRVTDTGITWPYPLLGLGAYFSRGGRYNDPSVPAVYCSEDPLVSITEMAFYQAMHHHSLIANSPYKGTTGLYPLRCDYRLWCFAINPPPCVIDLQNPNTANTFPHQPYLLRNPGQDYAGTQRLARDIRAYQPPAGAAQRRPEGVRASSVRTPRIAGYEPAQLALCITNPLIQQPFSQRNVLMDEWGLTIQFLNADTNGPVTYDTRHIAWDKPRFLLRGPSHNDVPQYAGRPNARTYSRGRWYKISIAYA